MNLATSKNPILKPKASIEQLHPENNSTRLLAFCKATADQLRLDILKVLSRESFGVLELVQIFNCKQSLISHHLKILANAGLVLRRREGNSIFYRRANTISSTEMAEMQKGLFNAIERTQLSLEAQQRLALIHDDRADKCQRYFRENANKFSQHQEQVAAYELYGPNAKELIASTIPLDSTQNTVLEIGPGEGEFLVELSQLFKRVIALDNSSEMLNKAQELATSQNLTNIDFVHGDTRNNSLSEQQINCVVLNMVLHHVPSPVEVLFDIAELLDENGQLFITELCSHDQSWVKTSCGDLWLGFEPEDLSDWTRNAGFKEGESVYLAQRNGFRVQIRQFLKC
ncbi:MAG: ArsR family transcriptional regulator [Gammaproteobacteria bacterium]|nr:MAG: ArsR family transcriptional regulator [Gammaproteobacteria bacterium]